MSVLICQKSCKVRLWAEWYYGRTPSIVMTGAMTGLYLRLYSRFDEIQCLSVINAGALRASTTACETILCCCEARKDEGDPEDRKLHFEMLAGNVGVVEASVAYYPPDALVRKRNSISTRNGHG